MEVLFKHEKGAVVRAVSVREVVRFILNGYSLVDSSVRETVWSWLETKYTERFHILEATKTMEELHSDKLLTDIALAWTLV